MRIRTVKPDFFKDEELAELPALTRILFQGLWCMADGEGRLEDRPIRIKAEVLPYDTCNVDKMLNVLNENDFIRRYEVNGKRYIQIVHFNKHQRITGKEAEKKSEIPACPKDWETIVKHRGNNGETAIVQEGKGRERKGREWKGKEKDIPPASPPDLVASPQKNGEKRAHWKEYVAHFCESIARKKGLPKPYCPDGQEIKALSTRYDQFGPDVVMACWDMWWESGQPWSDWAARTGRSIKTFVDSGLLTIMDDKRYKGKAEGYAQRWASGVPLPASLAGLVKTEA